MQSSFVLLGAAGIAGISIAGVVVVALIVVLAIFIHKRKYKSRYESLKKAYDDYHTLLTTDCKNMVNRLKTLGEHNESFNAAYLERQKQYDDIVKKRDSDVSQSLDSLEVLVQEKNYKDCKKIESQIQAAVNSFSMAVCNFNSELTNILRDDNDIHSNCVNVKAKYRQIHEFYDTNQAQLKPLQKPFEKIFSTSETQFAQFDLATNQADFEKAKQISASLDKLFDAVLSVMDSLPNLEVNITTVIPNKLDNLEKEHQKMIEEGFIVSEMHVEEKVAVMRKQIAEVQSQLDYLDTRGVEEKLARVQSAITDVQADFQEERNAKETYLSKQGILSESSFSVEQKYSTMMNQLPAYQKAFVLDSKYVTQMLSLKADIESIGQLKRELDSYLDTSARKPYVIITKKMTQMSNEMSKTTKAMDDYSNYLQSLKMDSSKVFQGLRECFVKLKDTQAIVKSIGVPAYYDSLKSTFEQDFREIKEITKIVITEPINVPLAKSRFVPFQESVNGLISSVENTKKEAERAETSIVYANAYRTEYTDAKPLLDQAEISFMEGDFSRASSLALQVVKTFSGNASLMNQ